ncbi:hypothetical protein LZD57_02450 [Jiella sp. CBK1P-4]|uniref:Uncharacterized protein n=1 Tax=Jiella avicenniae TaxID=2907202 RepID=A0A9X1NWI9_9HYPH|nr:hypothetical protein [Jiella avicenniae]
MQFPKAEPADLSRLAMSSRYVCPYPFERLADRDGGARVVHGIGDPCPQGGKPLLSIHPEIGIERSVHEFVRRRRLAGFDGVGDILHEIIRQRDLQRPGHISVSQMVIVAGKMR